MSDKQFVLTFNEDGTIDTEAVNFEGKECTEQAKQLYDLLGEEQSDKRKFKPAYSKQTRTQQQNNQRKLSR